MTTLPSISGFIGGLRQLGYHQKAIATSLERLATGKKVNQASDDPTGFQVADNLKYRQLQIDKKLERWEFEEAMLGATEGGLSVLQDLVLELDGVVVRGANTGGLSEAEIDAIGVEIDSILQGINHITTNTFFNGEQILAGHGPGLGDLKKMLAENPEKAHEAVKEAEDRLSGQRAAIGSRMKQIGHERNALLAEQEGNASVISSIEDTDYAVETAALVRSQILEQATISAILIDREQADRVLDLIASVPNGNRPIGK